MNWNRERAKILTALLLVGVGTIAWAMENKKPLEAVVVEELSRKFPETRIEIKGLSASGGTQLVLPMEVQFVDSDGNGTARFRVMTSERNTEIEVGFSAYSKVPVAKQLLRPGQKLESYYFEMHDMDVAQLGKAELLSLIPKSVEELAGFEATQTILEGKVPYRNQMRKIPIVRKGDWIKVRVSSGNLELMTQGIAQENGYMGEQVRVLTPKNRKEVTVRMTDKSVGEVVF